MKCIINLLEFLCSESESSFVHGCPEGVQSGVAGAAPGIPWSPLLPLLQHGVQVAPGSISNRPGDWVHLAEVIFHEKHPSCLTNYNGSNEETGAPQNESSVATAVAVSCVLVVLLLIACVLAVVVVAWGCSKYRKHKVTHKTPPVIDLMA